MAGPGEIYAVAERFRQELLRRERAAASEMVRQYGAIWRQIKARTEELMRQYYEAQAAGGAPAASWLFESRRLQDLQLQVESEIGKFVRFAEIRTVAEQWQAVQAAQRHVWTQVEGQLPAGVMPAWNWLPAEALQDLVGFTQDGSPLRSLLDKLGPAASESMRKVLIAGVALGQNPREIARLARAALGGNLARALAISRTEVLRAYREAGQRLAQANGDIIVGWRWLAAKQARTCVACLAMDGTVHGMDERLDDHPNGRCSRTWITRGAVTTPFETGQEWFDKQPEDVQRKVLGNAGYQAYQDLRIDLRDMVGRRSSQAWGTTRYRLPLRDAIRTSGMPNVTFAQGADPCQPAQDIRAAIRALRDRVGSLQGLNLEAVGSSVQQEGAFGWIESGPMKITLCNNDVAGYWQQDRALWAARIEAWEGRPGHRPCSIDLFSSAAQRAGETLKHEYGHWLILQKVGDYLFPGFWQQYLPPDLRREIEGALRLTGERITEYNIGEVIADDVRRYLTGTRARPNYLCWQSDLADLTGAWSRAGRLWQWLKTP